MPQKKRTVVLSAAILCLMLQACASIRDFVNIQDIFKGNTQRDTENYTLEDKSEYRKHNYLLKVKQKEEKREILKRMDMENKKYKKNSPKS